MRSRTKSQKNNADIAMIAGIQKYLPAATFLVDGQSQPSTQVVTVLQGRVNAANAVLTAEATWHGAVDTSDALYASTDAYVAAVRTTVLAMYASQPAILTAFAVKPRKQPAPRTAEEKVVSAAKAKATRTARGTMSAKKKATIVGTVTGAVMVPVDGSASSVVSSPPPAAAPPAATATANGTSTPHS
jgi:hypothetical protein